MSKNRLTLGRTKKFGTATATRTPIAGLGNRCPILLDDGRAWAESNPKNWSERRESNSLLWGGGPGHNPYTTPAWIWNPESNRGSGVTSAVLCRLSYSRMQWI